MAKAIAKAEYWLQTKTTCSKIGELEEQYGKIVKESMKLANILTNNVNVSGIWCDQNARKLAEWWNQGGDSGGELVYSKEGGLGWKGGASDFYDGEDRIKSIVQATGRLYWLAVCWPIRALKDSYIDEVSTYLNKQYKAGNNKEYEEKRDITKKVWSDMMANEFGCTPKWEKTTIDTTKKDGGNDTAKIEKFLQDLDTSLKNLQRKL